MNSLNSPCSIKIIGPHIAISKQGAEYFRDSFNILGNFTGILGSRKIYRLKNTMLAKTKIKVQLMLTP
ncbi:hypothetical protein XBP1_650057 [Xenorhabdus bovienii str. puntauvense]|uniref:Uncharacterized protein n=2 Tax=Xenorhabdus bovienii TaxID=40576 RepID=A0A0B6X7X2_XENBV|nr:hypothetical protein XBFFR1_1490039 [Xenorhabdus bovienii str. feltiae France]CDG92866.1 hypothetical protein XBFFL1_2360039 [Xenorhabdus bovienii str. feltiae Florida]CDG98975.1 hypothetical protein XBP1_650057 [Xenorhabdus bovienii str. puntauvense]CDM88414.1 protein of unknown function [Xenorhabdus bovienii]